MPAAVQVGTILPLSGEFAVEKGASIMTWMPLSFDLRDIAEGQNRVATIDTDGSRRLHQSGAPLPATTAPATMSAPSLRAHLDAELRRSHANGTQARALAPTRGDRTGFAAGSTAARARGAV